MLCASWLGKRRYKLLPLRENEKCRHDDESATCGRLPLYRCHCFVNSQCIDAPIDDFGLSSIEHMSVDTFLGRLYLSDAVSEVPQQQGWTTSTSSGSTLHLMCANHKNFIVYRNIHGYNRRGFFAIQLSAQSIGEWIKAILVGLCERREPAR